MNERFDRQMRFFGTEGQDRLSAAQVAVVGVGGLGIHVVQQLAMLGVGALTFIDSEELSVTDRNRNVGARHDDPIPGTWKVDICERLVKAIDPAIHVGKIHDSFISEQAFEVLKRTDYVFGCLDSEGARLVLSELCAAYSRPYFDLASDIVPGEPPNYGGRICVAWDGNGCIICFGLMDIAEAQADLAGPAGDRDGEAVYGVKRGALGRSGPSVVSINGVVASLAVTEFMVAVAGVRPPKRLIKYYAHMGRLSIPTEEPASDCYYCKGIRGRRDAVDMDRYIRATIGKFLR